MRCWLSGWDRNAKLFVAERLIDNALGRSAAFCSRSSFRSFSWARYTYTTCEMKTKVNDWHDVVQRHGLYQSYSLL